MSALNLSLEEIVAKTTDLPTMPVAAIAVMRETEAPTGSAQSVARHLSQDQALTARVLRLANSAFYGLSRQVREPQEAVVVLGMRSVRSLAVVAATYPMLSKPLAGYNIGPEDLWAHSFGTAVAAQTFASRIGGLEPDVAFTAGLLHNMGKLALSVWLENKLTGLTAIAERAGMSFDAIERQLLGYDHADVGAHLAERWNLPPSLTTAIKYHHRPSEAPTNQLLVDAIHLGDYLAMSLGIGLSGEGMRYTLDKAALSRSNLTEETFEALGAEFMEKYEQHERIFDEAA